MPNSLARLLSSLLCVLRCEYVHSASQSVRYNLDFLQLICCAYISLNLLQVLVEWRTYLLNIRTPQSLIHLTARRHNLTGKTSLRMLSTLRTSAAVNRRNKQTQNFCVFGGVCSRACTVRYEDNCETGRELFTFRT